MGNKVEFGLSNVYFALAEFDANGNVTYGVPHRQPGAVSMTLEPSGDSSPYYADNIVYYNAVANQGYTGNLEMALFDEWFHTEIMGAVKDDNGVLVENANAVPKPFAMLYQVEGDQKAARRVLYNVIASRGSDKSNTKTKTAEPQSTTVNITVSPLPADGLIRANTTESVAAERYLKWFDEVYMPNSKTATPSEPGDSEPSGEIIDGADLLRKKRAK